MMCERCWADAYIAEVCDPSKDQAEHYQRLLVERGQSQNIICSPKDQAGQWWDDDKQIDTRTA